MISALNSSRSFTIDAGPLALRVATLPNAGCRRDTVAWSYGVCRNSGLRDCRASRVVTFAAEQSPPNQNSRPLSLAKTRGKVVPYEGAPPTLEAVPDPQGDSETRVTFWLKFKAEYGQRIRVVGSCPALGSWVAADAPELQWNEGHMWHVVVGLPCGTVHQYKFAVFQSDGITPAAWQQGNNAVLAIMDEDAMEVFDEWLDVPTTAVVSNGQRSTRSERLMAWADTMSATVAVQRQELRRTRMELFQAEEESRSAKEAHEVTATTLAEANAQTKKLMAKMKAMEETTRQLRLQLVESQIMFQEAMGHARELLLSTLEDAEDDEISDHTDDEDDDDAGDDADGDDVPAASARMFNAWADDTSIDGADSSSDDAAPSGTNGSDSAPRGASVSASDSDDDDDSDEGQAPMQSLDEVMQVLQRVELEASEGQDGIAKATQQQPLPVAAVMSARARSPRLRTRSPKLAPRRATAPALESAESTPSAPRSFWSSPPAPVPAPSQPETSANAAASPVATMSPPESAPEKRTDNGTSSNQNGRLAANDREARSATVEVSAAEADAGEQGASRAGVETETPSPAPGVNGRAAPALYDWTARSDTPDTSADAKAVNGRAASEPALYDWNARNDSPAASGKDNAATATASGTAAPQPAELYDWNARSDDPPPSVATSASRPANATTLYDWNAPSDKPSTSTESTASSAWYDWNTPARPADAPSEPAADAITSPASTTGSVYDWNASFGGETKSRAKPKRCLPTRQYDWNTASEADAPTSQNGASSRLGNGSYDWNTKTDALETAAEETSISKQRPMYDWGSSSEDEEKPTAADSPNGSSESSNSSSPWHWPGARSDKPTQDGPSTSSSGSGSKEDNSWEWPSSLKPSKSFWESEGGKSEQSSTDPPAESRWGRPIKPFF